MNNAEFYTDSTFSSVSPFIFSHTHEAVSAQRKPKVKKSIKKNNRFDN